ncbi:MAG TPA: EscU/YscU/HrcU family type III secretion system export apparatus switch protein [Terriglobales bacterium]|jgi:flagellar biosynthetic protein FlhB|nr:EscU/YscU/HrcU family type III secretion system export apparatus switch protein [Terriglobales bacterium]
MSDNKTEKPTPRRRQKAREQGQVARSRDLSSTLAVSGAVGLIAWQGYSGIEAWRGLLRHAVDLSGGETLSPAAPLFMWTGWTVARCVVPVMAAAWMLSVFAGVAQGGLVFAPEALLPKIERLSPAKKLGQMFSLTGLSGLLKSLLPFAAIGYLGATAIRDHWGAIMVASNTNLFNFAHFLLTTVFEVAWKSALALLVWALVDYFLTWRKSESDLRMSREEMRQESKDTDGNPQIKMRIRRLQRQMRKQFMLRETEKATVVVTNPTHFAVAILYQMDMGAPVVIAKGQNLLAQKMKQIARWKEIPVLENPPLAQALYKTVDVGQSIPAKLYTAVAEVLAFVYRAQAQVRRQAQAERR